MSRARALCAGSCCPVGRFTESVSLRASYGVGRARRSRGLTAFCEDYRARRVCAYLQPRRLIRIVGISTSRPLACSMSSPSSPSSFSS